jgi:hypothetical protein
MYGVVGSRDSNPSRPLPFAVGWFTAAWGERSPVLARGFEPRLARFKGRASAVGLGEQNAATGPVRTDAARCLKPLSPTGRAAVYQADARAPRQMRPPPKARCGQLSGDQHRLRNITKTAWGR